MQTKRFFKRGLLFVSPFILWTVVIIVVDPFDYFNMSHVFTERAKEETAAKVNSLTFNMLKEEHEPCENIIIGDSRAEALPLERIEQITGQRWFKLSAYALKLNESMDLFYFANRVKPVKNVVFTINFNEYNDYAYADRVHSVETIIHNPLIYIFDRNVAQAAYYVVEATLNDKKTINSEPQMSSDEFWNYIVKVRGREHYGKYRYPERLHQDLQKMMAFVKTNGINATFIIVPHHEDFQREVGQYGLNEDYVRFKNDMSNLGARVIDYDYVSDITTNRADFVDPIHYNKKIGNLISDEVFRGPLKEGKSLDNSWATNFTAYLFN